MAANITTSASGVLPDVIIAALSSPDIINTALG
jgi:hypothetical protein